MYLCVDIKWYRRQSQNYRFFVKTTDFFQIFKISIRCHKQNILKFGFRIKEEVVVTKWRKGVDKRQQNKKETIFLFRMGFLPLHQTGYT